jgi:hypothetical protein
MFLLASSDSHSCETLAEYAGVAIATDLSKSGKAKWPLATRVATSRSPCIYECLIDPLIAKK